MFSSGFLSSIPSFLPTPQHAAEESAPWETWGKETHRHPSQEETQNGVDERGAVTAVNAEVAITKASGGETGGENGRWGG